MQYRIHVIKVTTMIIFNYINVNSLSLYLETASSIQIILNITHPHPWRGNLFYIIFKGKIASMGSFSWPRGIKHMTLRYETA